MTHFLKDMNEDLRHGRESWRVLAALTIPAFALAVAIKLLF